ncbi:MAG TPA: HPr family phosphocarrier protein [Desulfotomaculum sp.]|nr:HPr family phosphocarrier protein [Desulfotomaculum sp.]
MLQKSFLVKNKTGLHARPASIFIRTANKYKCDIRLKKGDQEIDAKSMISLLSLGVGQGTTIKIITSGEDEEAAMNELMQLLESFSD